MRGTVCGSPLLVSRCSHRETGGALPCSRGLVLSCFLQLFLQLARTFAFSFVLIVPRSMGSLTIFG